MIIQQVHRQVPDKQTGASAVEYGLIIGLVAVALVTILTTLGGAGGLGGLFQTVIDSLP